MDKKLKAKWVKALRSGKFKQCRGSYHSAGAYCCLGVLVLVDRGISRYSRFTQASPSEEKLPRNECFELIAMNDGGKSFAEIADYIEKNL